MVRSIKGISFLHNREIGYLEIIEEKDGISEISFLGNINIEDAIEELKKAKDGDDRGAIDAAIEKLSQASHKFAEDLYREAQAQAQAQQQAGANTGSDNKADDVAEAEVVD